MLQEHHWKHIGAHGDCMLKKCSDLAPWSKLESLWEGPSEQTICYHIVLHGVAKTGADSAKIMQPLCFHLLISAFLKHCVTTS